MTQTAWTRREFIHLTLVSAAALALPSGCTPAPPGPRLFSDDERQMLAGLADYVLPPDEQPGGAALGAVEYIEGLLTALEVDPPRIFAGGPFSGRNPLPDEHGNPTGNYPENGFTKFLPLTRQQDLGWRLRLYGSAGVPGGGPNDAVLGPVVGLRDQVRGGLAMAIEAARPLSGPRNQKAWQALWESMPLDTRNVVLDLILEAAVSAPEYGGNRDLAGWRMIHFEGDTLPLGFSLFDQTTNQYHDRPDAPVVAANPGPDLDPLDAQTYQLLDLAVSVLGGRKFF